MNQQSKHGIYLLALMSCANLAASSDCVNATPYFSIRSQSTDSARELVGWANDYHINLYNMCDNYGSFAITLEGTRSIRSRRIARCLFGDSLLENCNEPTIRISGSEVQTRGGRDWLADNFFLAPDFESKITFKPQVSNIILDFNLYYGLDCWYEGLYFRIHAPVVHTRWRLNPREEIKTQGVADIPAGYFGADQVNNAQVLKSALETLSGQKSGTSLITPLQCAKIAPCGCTLSDTKLSDIVWAFGWNFLQDEDYHIGLNIRGAFPTGTRPTGEYLFEPIVGNGHHYELGGGLTSHVILWRDCDYEQYVGVYLDANFTHLFKTRQRRSFDLCNSPNSRYMLALNLGVPVEDNLQGNSGGAVVPLPTSGFTAPNSQFKDKYTYVANLTCADVKVSSAIQADITFLVDYTYCGYSFDVGYNFWGRSCEKIDFKCPVDLESKTWALKGDAGVYGFPMTTTDGTDALSGGDPVALSPSESNASIYAGTNRPCGDVFSSEQRRNPNIDNAEFAYSGTLPLLAAPLTEPVQGFVEELANQTRTSIDPVLITPDKIDCQAARTKGLTHKIFANLSYTWNERECLIPYLGIGGKAEFAQGCGQCDKSCNASTGCPVVNVDCSSVSSCAEECTPNCTDCKKCALSEWGVWIKGGVSFN